METVGTGAGRVDLKLQIGSAQQLTFVFTDEDISGKTFSFALYEYKGSRKKIFNYTNQSGIQVPVYSTDEIRVNILAADVTTIGEGEYYYELRREDLDKPKVYGLAYLSFDAK